MSVVASPAPFTISPLEGATFGAVVTGARLAGIDDEAFAAVYRAWLDHGLLIFPSRALGRAEQIAFAWRFGELEFDIAPISNVRRDGSVRPDDDDGGDVMTEIHRRPWGIDAGDRSRLSRAGPERKAEPQRKPNGREDLSRRGDAHSDVRPLGR